MSRKNSKTQSKSVLGLETIIQRLKSSEQTISMLLGIAIVLLVGSLLYHYFQNRSLPKSKLGSGEENFQETSLLTPENVNLPYTHTVVKGENLWLIAEKYFHSGYNWVDIAKENNLQNPNILSQGEKIIIPNVSPREITAKVSTAKIIPGTEYEIQKGDSLSLIAVKAYGVGYGYQWVEIWKNNKKVITNPNLISPGQKITIPVL